MTDQLEPLHRRRKDDGQPDPSDNGEWSKWAVRIFFGVIITVAASMANQRLTAIEEVNRAQAAKDEQLQQQLIELRKDMNNFMLTAPRREDIDRLQAAADALTKAVLQRDEGRRK